LAPIDGIDSIESLRTHLQWAIELEHSTIPPYLCALYSLDPDRNREVVDLVASVLIEEMLHMTLAANLLNAVGGRPRFDSPQMLPGYPRCLPHSDHSFEVSLVRFSPEALDLFMKIEQPSPSSGRPEGDHYETIGQFYEAIEAGLRSLCDRLGEAAVFCGDAARQLTDESFFGPGERVVAVYDLASALDALNEIVQQGEGADHSQVWDGDRDMFHPERQQVGHYYRFQELRLGRRYRPGDTPQTGPTGEPIAVDWAGVRPMRKNPRTTDHAPDSPARLAQEAFNRGYCGLLAQLEQAFNGRPDLLGPAVDTMYELKAQAEALMQVPTGDGESTAGPTFEYVRPDRR
jgi:hypothetical protein